MRAHGVSPYPRDAPSSQRGDYPPAIIRSLLIFLARLVLASSREHVLVVLGLLLVSSRESMYSRAWSRADIPVTAYTVVFVRASLRTRALLIEHVNSCSVLC